MIVASHRGMLSRGVLLPDKTTIGSAMNMKSNPSCGIERATVPRKMPMAVAKNKYNAVPAKNSGTDPAIGTPSNVRTTIVSERPAAAVMTNPFAHTFDAAISNGETGITN